MSEINRINDDGSFFIITDKNMNLCIGGGSSSPARARVFQTLQQAQRSLKLLRSTYDYELKKYVKLYTIKKCFVSLEEVV